MNREICAKCKNYFSWEDISVAPDNKGLFTKKAILNEVCCKVNKDIEKIKRCNSYEEYEISCSEKDPEEVKVEEEQKVEEPKKEVRKYAEGRRKKR